MPASPHAHDAPSSSSRLAGGLGLITCAGLFTVGCLASQAEVRPRLLVAPMIGNLDDCLAQDPVSARLPVAFRPRPASCEGPGGSATELIEQTLAPLAPSGPAEPMLALGYTLNLPLLRMLDRNGDGQWQVNRERVARYVNTLAQGERQAVLYLFATHFGVDAPIEDELARDPANLAHTQDGPLPVDTYLDYRIYPWSVARTDNGITRARDQVIAEVARQVCTTPQALAKVSGVTVLGEVHQLYPRFETGMGFESDYRISDYSPASVRGFQNWLARHMGSVAELNRRLGSDFKHFDEVQPPRLDIRKDRLNHYFEHIDAYAHGTVPVSGWVHVPDAVWGDAAPAVPATLIEARKPQVLIALNGQIVGHTSAELSRQDVAEARPDLGTPDVGWRFDLPFAGLPTGTHRVDVLLALPGGPPALLGSRHINVMDSRQQTPQPQPMRASLPTRDLPAGVAHYLDWPREAMDVYFNPLAPLWHAFRADQVARYLQHAQQQVSQTCLAQKPIYIHQLYPNANPSWDANRYAVQRSFEHRAAYGLGISLYGAPSYSFSFGEGLRAWGQHSYGVTEFHPSRVVDARQMATILALHRWQGARFLSFFMEARPPGSTPERIHNPFSFDPDSRVRHGAALYQAVRQAMNPQ